ncbi:hypothetical protein [Adhaeribacter pallidiroseus]|uniref:Uncharacterized protein n=1 Tax=Adhaeribacter pallidiroseus TaxID=2072847 RepID=A0A369QH04_9BACT|nr:hypothetical protein [Adhaeribacter pallidiroseus]RDC64014.1 hypothetical protein AHMF7616_02624 [Adhaeribacter pallidiroseus]
MLQHLKTSTILLLTAAFILLGSLVAYNMALKTEYNKGTYKDPYRNFVTLNYRDFDQIIINPATEINVKILSGDYKVQVHPFVTDFVQIKKNGQHLQVDLVYPKEEKRQPYGDLVVITCPKLDNLKTNAFYSIQGKKITSTKSWDDNTVTVQGFQQSAFSLQQDKATAVKLSGNKITRLEAVVGVSTGSSARLNLDKTNHIQEAHLDIRNKSELVIENLNIPKRQYQFSDSARATFTGSALGILAQ